MSPPPASVVCFIQDAAERYNGKFLSLLEVAREHQHRVDLAGSFGYWMQHLVEKANIDKEHVDWLFTVALMWQYERRKEEPTQAAVNLCGRIIMYALETVMDAREFGDVIKLFPKLSQHHCLSAQRVRFMKEFGTILSKDEVDSWVIDLNHDLFPRIQFSTQSAMLNHLGMLKRKNKNHPLSAVLKKTLRWRIQRVLFFRHSLRKDEQMHVSQHEILGLFRKTLVRRARRFTVARAKRVAEGKALWKPMEKKIADEFLGTVAAF